MKHYFFPGFTPRTGGLLREAGLLERRDEFQADAGAQAAFWTSLAGKPPPTGAEASLFGYAGAPVDALARSCCSTRAGVADRPRGAAAACARAVRSTTSPAATATRRPAARDRGVPVRFLRRTATTSCSGRAT